MRGWREEKKRKPIPWWKFIRLFFSHYKFIDFFDLHHIQSAGQTVLMLSRRSCQISHPIIYLHTAEDQDVVSGRVQHSNVFSITKY